MTIVSASFLWYLPLCLLPFVIYYLMRRFPAPVTWGAHYVLDCALRRLRRKLIDEHMLLLFIRLCALALVIVAFARIMLRDAGEQGIRGSGVHHVIVFDTSYSMLAIDGEQSRWNHAMTGVRELLSLLGKGESWSLLVLGNEPRWVVERANAGSDADARALLDNLRASETRTGILQALRALRDKVALAECALYLFVDDQASFWAGADEVLNTDRPESCYWFCPPLDERRNMAVTMVAPAADHVLKGHPLRVFAKARNESANEERVQVEFLLDGKIAGVVPVTLLPGMEEQIYTDITMEHAGAAVVSARVKPDVLPYDDVLHAGVEVLAELKVLVLCDEKRGHFFSSWPLLGHLNQAQEKLEELYGPVTFVLGTLPLNANELKAHDIVLVADPVEFDEAQAAILKGFAEQGGGILFAPSMHTNRDNWNAVLGPELLPARLGDSPAWDLDPGSPFKSIAVTGFDKLDMAAYTDEDYGRLLEVQYFHYFDLVFDEDRHQGSHEYEVLMRFTDHAPALIRRRVGKGAAVLYASGLNGFENTMPACRIYPGMVYRMLRCAIQAGRLPLTVAPNRTFLFRVPESEGPVQVSLLFEGRPSLKPQLRSDARGTLAEVPGGLPLSGLATVLTTAATRITRSHVGIQGQRLDSDLTPVADLTLAPVVDSWGLVRVEDGDALRRELLQAQQGLDMYSWVLAVGMLLLLVELVYQQRFSRRRP